MSIQQWILPKGQALLFALMSAMPTSFGANSQTVVDLWLHHAHMTSHGNTFRLHGRL